MTVNQLYRAIVAEMTPAVGEGEARSAADIIFDDVLLYDKLKRVVSGDRVLEDFTVDRVVSVVRRFIAGEPLQYIIGHTTFDGFELNVTPAVLIPRPETAQLVDMIVADFGARSDVHVLDCGTGSGCIAVALARSLKFPAVDAIDISEAALDVARENARLLGVHVAFSLTDIMKLSAPAEPVYDVIVSNPPYICDNERASMELRVTGHEPSLALFVPDDDPLKFYRAVAKFAFGALKPSGSLYFEINPLYVVELKSMILKTGFDEVSVTRDYKGNYRFCRASKRYNVN